MIKNYQSLIGLIFITLINNVFAAPIQCIATVTKAAGWANYDVTINLMDYTTKKPITTLELKAANPNQKQGTINSLSQNFNCEQHPMIYFVAQYTPVMWKENIGKIYQSLHFWNMQPQMQQPKPGIDKLEITINFPADFEGVPTLIEGIH